MNEKYRDAEYNEKAPKEVWGEDSKTLKVLRGPARLDGPISLQTAPYILNYLESF